MNASRRRIGGCAVAVLLAAVPIVGVGCGSQASGSEASGGQASTTQPSGTTTAKTVVGARDTNSGTVLVDASNHTLYTFTRGDQCSGKCATAWPPLLAEGRVVASNDSGVKQQLLGKTQRPDGKFQATYHGHPLYLFAQDEHPGETLGEQAHAFGGDWNVVRISGNPLKKQKTSGPSCEPNCGY